MKKIFVMSFVIVLSYTLKGQKTIDYENLHSYSESVKDKIKTLSIDSLNFYFEKDLSEYREGIGTGKVKFNKSILKVSLEQSSYCSNNDVFTHDQPSSEKSSPGDRCVYFGIDSWFAGENLLKSNIFILGYLKHKKGMNFYQDLSASILQSWKDSPGHNKTMIDGSGTNFALGYTINSKNEMIACLVLTSD